MPQFDHIGRYIYTVLLGFRTSFRDGSIAGGWGRFFGSFIPYMRIATATSGTYFPRDHELRYGVGVGIDNRNNVGPEMGSERWTPEPIVYLLRHPDNPMSLTPEARTALLTSPIDGTVLWQEAKLDCSCVLVNGKPAFEKLEEMARALGYGAAPAPAESAATPAAPASTLPELAPVEQRAKEIAAEAMDVWGYHSPAWLDNLVSPAFVREVAESVALLAIPIWRRAQERIAQRAAEIVLAKLEGRR